MCEQTIRPLYWIIEINSAHITHACAHILWMRWDVLLHFSFCISMFGTFSFWTFDHWIDVSRTNLGEKAWCCCLFVLFHSFKRVSFVGCWSFLSFAGFWAVLYNIFVISCWILLRFTRFLFLHSSLFKTHVWRSSLPARFHSFRNWMRVRVCDVLDTCVLCMS